MLALVSMETKYRKLYCPLVAGYVNECHQFIDSVDRKRVVSEVMAAPQRQTSV